MPYAILGTGRSGTSMVTRMLNLCGLFIGDQDGLKYADSNPGMNPAGYWEHPGIHSFMDRLFEHLGGTWENPPLLLSGWEYDTAIEPFYAEAKGLVARLYGDYGDWAWKLPKATVTIEFWQRVVPDLKFIICVRNPLDFARSMGRHVLISRSHLFAMWQYYNYSILSVTEPENRIVTFYEDYFPCYRAGLAPLLEFTGLPNPAPGDELDQSIRRFCDQDLKHYGSTFTDVLADDEVPYVTQQLYLEMLCGDARASSLPMLSYQAMLLPLLQRTLVGEGVLDGSGAVSTVQYEKLKREMKALRAEKRGRLNFVRTKFFKNALNQLRLCTQRNKVGNEIQA